MDTLSPAEKLYTAIKVLEDLSKKILKRNFSYIGSAELKPHKISDKFYDRTVNLNLSTKKKDSEIKEPIFEQNLDFLEKKYYVFESFLGTPDEMESIKHYHSLHSKLQLKFDEIYLFPNYGNLKIFNLDDGNGIHPSFVLFLNNDKNSAKKS